MEKILLLRTAYMKSYEGKTADDIPINGGSYVKEHEDGAEHTNFKIYDDGKCRGFAEPMHFNGKRKQIKLERIDKSFAGKDSADGITVVWCATAKKDGTIVTGWYKNATVFRTVQEKDGNLFNVITDSKNIIRIPEEKRNFAINKSNTGFMFGRSSIRYIENEQNYKKIKDYMDDYIKSQLK